MIYWITSTAAPFYDAIYGEYRYVLFPQEALDSPRRKVRERYLLNTAFSVVTNVHKPSRQRTHERTKDRKDGRLRLHRTH